MSGHNINEEFRFGGNFETPQIPPKADARHDGRHDRNQSLPNVNEHHPNSHGVMVRPHRAATYSRAGSSYHTNMAAPAPPAPLVPSKSSDRAPQLPQALALSSPLAQSSIIPLNKVSDDNNLTGVGLGPTSPTGPVDSNDQPAMTNLNATSNIPAVSPSQTDPSAVSTISVFKRSGTTPRHQKPSNQTASKGGEPKTPSEYALHILFTQFVRHAEKKLNVCLNYMRDSEPLIDEILRKGVDTHFDKIVASLGYIARHKPKPVIDSVMFWRKSKAEAAAAAAQALDTATANAKQQQRENQKPPASHSRSVSRVVDIEAATLEARENALHADKKSLISIFILCRVLMEIVNQTPPQVLGDDLSGKLEEIVYKQLKTADSHTLSRNNIRRSNWNLFAALLGEMSRNRFASVGDRFIADLEKLPDSPAKEAEASIRLIIVGMKFLQLKLYPMDSLEESAEFLESIAKFFGRSQSQSVKIAYSDVVSQILMPLAGPASAELNHPVWAKAITSLYAKSSEMLQKPRYWSTAYPLASILMCVAPQEMFTQYWMPFFEASMSKMKDRSNKVVLFTGTTRLLWVFTFRWTESLNNTTKKLDTICKVLLMPSNRKAWASSTMEKGIMASCITIIRISAHAYLQYVLENILFQMLIGTQNSPDNVVLENVLSERSIIAIRSFIYILSDIELGRKPEFPTIDVLRKTAHSSVEQPNSMPKPNNTVKPSYDRFCKVIGRLAVLLDTQVGTQAMQQAENQPQSNKPMAVSFHFGNDNSSSQAQKQGYLDLYKVVLETIPWCLPSDSSMTKSMVEILGKNLVHPNRAISEAATRSLKCLARTKETRTIITTYIQMVFAMDERLLASAEAPLTAGSDFEKMLRIYVELLEVWIENIQEYSSKSAGDEEREDMNNGNGESAENDKRTDDILFSNVWPSIEEVEGNGLFFLCSQDRSIRHLALKILKLTLKFDCAIAEAEGGKSQNSHSRQASMAAPSRIIQYMESADTSALFDSAKPEIQLSVPERSRLAKLHGRKKENLVKLAESDYGVDAALWIKAFPLFMKECFEKYPMPVAICRNIVCIRLVRMYDVVVEFTRSELAATGGAVHSFVLKHPMRTHPEVVVEQWRIFLVVTCCTLTLTDEQKLHIPDTKYQHGRKKSVQKVTIHHQRITSVRSVFRMVIPLLGIGHPIIRDAIVNGISSINVNIYKTLLECLHPAFTEWKDKLKRPGTSSTGGAFSSTSAAISSFSAGMSARRDSGAGYRSDWVITEIAHLLQVTSHYLDVAEIIEDEWIITELVVYLNEFRNLLSLPEVQIDFTYSKLRRYFCKLLENVYLGLSANQNRVNPIVFGSRMKFFILVEEWCPFGQQLLLRKEREEVMKRNALAACRDSREHNMVLGSFELEKRKFETAVISAMAALCLGSVSQEDPAVARGSALALNVNGLLNWINALLSSTRDDMHVIGRRALKNLLLTNPDNAVILEEAVANSYENHEQVKSSESFFMTTCEVFKLVPDFPCQVRQPLALGLFKTGDENPDIRRLAVTLLKDTEVRFYGSSCLKEYEVSIISPTMAVYKRAMFNLSTKFAKLHPEETFMVFSELTKFFHLVDDMSRRDILTVLLPWIQCVELQCESHNDHPTPSSAMVMNNLFEITVVFSGKIQNEVEALWVALANGGYPGNVKVIMDFILHYSLQRRDPLFVEYSRKILVYLAATPAGLNIMDSLLAHLQPKSMIPMYPEPYDQTVAEAIYPYVANIAEILPIKGKEASFWKGQLAMILLVDLVFGPQEDINPHKPLMLHVAFALFDHYMPTVYEQARELLIHIVHEYTEYSDEAIELCEELRTADYSSWSYDSLNNDKTGARAPKVMVDMISKVCSVFAVKMPDLRQKWASVALQWATTCPVRHIACRSFQVFRCLLINVDQNMLADMLARLSNTIADSSVEIQGFAMQILMTLNAITAELPGEELINCPQLFWATVACMGTIHEQEFIESLSILEKYLSKIDLDSPDTVSCLVSTFPPKWEGTFLGLQEAVIPGLSSSIAYEQTLRVLDKLNYLRDSDIIAGPERLVLAIMINMPRYLHAIDADGVISREIEKSSLQVMGMCEAHATQSDRLGSLARILNSVSKKRFRSKKDFLQQTVQAIQVNFFPEHEVTVLIFLLGMLSNKTRWIKEEVMEILKLLLPSVDMQREEFAGIGADIISPLLRLLQTDYAEEALSVLDTAVSIPASQMDKHVLRMSLGNRTIRKEYERTATLFGIPDDSGWAIPMPAVTASIVRNNVHAVFYTCGNSNAGIPSDNDADIITIGGVSAAPEDFQFQKDEYGYYVGRNSERQDSVSMAEGDFENNSLTNMWTALDNLDLFFTKDMRRASRNGAQRKGSGGNGLPARSPLSNGVAVDQIDGETGPKSSTAVERDRNNKAYNPSRFRSKFRMNDGLLTRYNSRNDENDGGSVEDTLLMDDEHPAASPGRGNATDLSRNNSVSTTDHRHLLHNPETGRHLGHAHHLSVTDTDTSTDIAMDPVENVPQLYDKKVSLILNRSLARTASTTSFKTYLADSFGNSPLTPTSSDAGLRAPSNSARGGNLRLVSVTTNNSTSGENNSSSENETGYAIQQGSAVSEYPTTDFTMGQIRSQNVFSPPLNSALVLSAGDVPGSPSVSFSNLAIPPQTRTPQESSFRLDSFLRASHLRKGKKKDKAKSVETGSTASGETATTEGDEPDRKPRKDHKDKDKDKRKRSLSKNGIKPTSLASSLAGKFGGSSSPSSAKSGASPQRSPASNGSSPSAAAAAAAALSSAKRGQLSPTMRKATGVKSPTPAPRGHREDR